MDVLMVILEQLTFLSQKRTIMLPLCYRCLSMPARNLECPLELGLIDRREENMMVALFITHINGEDIYSRIPELSVFRDVFNQVMQSITTPSA